SYEDFIRGWRPSGDGRLTLVDGHQIELIRAAENDPTASHVVVIEEINRGNPAQVFGEMLTLLEADKRTPTEALELSYRGDEDERVFIPANLYVIGTMNIADRSLALVDLALRRRFAFIDLEPALGKPWHDWMQARCGIDPATVSDIENRLTVLNDAIASLHPVVPGLAQCRHDWMQARCGIDPATVSDIENRLTVLNDAIAADAGLGPQFRIGHSYVTPPQGVQISDAREWFRQVVETEIGPLLDEYWFDALERAREARNRLLEGF